MRDNDYVLTTRELAEWAKSENIDFAQLKESKFDQFMGESSGAGLIFGNTGGVMEAALRTAYEIITKEKAPELFYELESVRGMEEVKEATVVIGEYTLNVAVIFGTGNVRKMLPKLEESGKKYHFIEVMTCPGGCIGGAGQPKHNKVKLNAMKQKRAESLYVHDREMKIRASYENEEVQALYREFYGEPLSELAEELLHTIYTDRSDKLGITFDHGDDEEIAI